MGSDKFEKLRKWIEMHGGYVSPYIKVVSSKVGDTIQHGVYAIKTISEKTEILRVPLCCKFGGELVYEIPEIEKWVNIDNNNLIENNFYCKIIIALIYHKSLGKKSFYYPYIKHLPRSIDFKDHPIYNYSEDKIEEWFKCSSIFTQELQSFMIKLNKITSFIKEAMEQHPIIDLSKFGDNPNILDTLIKWAFAIFLTRAWEEHGCIPFADLFNHQSVSQTVLRHYIPKQREGISAITVLSSYEQGDEIYNNYGQYDNKSLYITYGFWENEPVKYMKFKVNFTPTTAISAYIEQILKKENIPKKKILLTSRAPSGLLMKYLRITSISDRDIPFINGKRNIGDKPISPSNELIAYKNLLKLINGLKANEYSTERFNDCQLLNETSDNIITKNLSTIVTTEYEVIKNCIIWVHANWMAKLETPILNDLINFISTIDIS